jgi:hypothetical protein
LRAWLEARTLEVRARPLHAELGAAAHKQRFCVDQRLARCTASHCPTLYLGNDEKRLALLARQLVNAGSRHTWPRTSRASEMLLSTA